MEGRKRTVQVKFYVTEEERRLIREKNEIDTNPKYGRDPICERWR